MQFETPKRSGPPRLLEEDEETIARFREFGRRGLSKPQIARMVGVHRQTVADFLDRAPLAKAAWEEGLAEWRAADRAEREAASPPLPARRAALKAGGTCPTCGARVGDTDGIITLTAAEIAEAQRTLDDLIDRHLAKRDAETDTAE